MEQTSKTAATSGEDRISALPDDVLHLLLSRLPSDDVVRTSVLARRWRHLWRSARAIRVGPRCRHHCGWTQRTLTSFVNHLLLLRGCAPVDECDISCDEVTEDEDYYSDDHMSACKSRRQADEDLSEAAGLWIRHAVSFCEAKVLKFSVRSSNRLRIPEVPFVSEKLTRVEIAEAKLAFDTLDFSRCPALEVLEFSMSRIEVCRILSPSLRRLRLEDCNFTGETRARISTPRLVSLHVTVSSGCAPALDGDKLMLVVAHVRIEDGYSYDICKRRESPYLDCDREGCFECKGVGDGGSMLFQGLSRVTDLELTCDPRVFIFRRDCQFCTTFGNLKTLVLNEWCMTPDFSTLVYFLRYTPVLENLTLQLEYCDGPRAVSVTNEQYNPKEYFLVSKQLNVVEIKCQRENQLVRKLLMILEIHGVSQEKINIEQNFYPSCEGGYETDDSDYGEYW